MSKLASSCVALFFTLGCSSVPTIDVSDPSLQPSTSAAASSSEVPREDPLPEEPAREEPLPEMTVPPLPQPERPDADPPSEPIASNDPEVPASAAPCPDASELVALTPDAGLARYGTVFGSSMYEANDAASYDRRSCKYVCC